MFCKNCGAELPEGAKFCGRCGTPVIPEDQEESEETTVAEEQEGYGEPVASEDQSDSSSPDTSQKRKRKRILIPIILIVAAAVVVLVILFAGGGSKSRQYQNHMEAGQLYLDEEAYEEALTEFTEAIEIDPNEVDPYARMAEAYLGLGDTDGVEGTYDAARAMITSAYENSNELPEGAAGFYNDAIDYYIGHENFEDVIEATDEFVGMGSDEENQNFIDKEQAFLKESATEVLSLFPYWSYDSLYAWYEENDNELMEFEEMDAAQVFYLAAEVSLEPDQDSSEYFMDWDSSYHYSNGDMLADDTGFYNSSAPYGLLFTDAYEEHIVNMFGSQYDLEDFEEYQSASGVKVRRDSAGEFYLQMGGDWGEEVVTVSVEDVSDSDEEGAFHVLAKYTASFYEGEEDICYMWVRMMPDAGSSYGCVVTGMIPAGHGEVDETYLQTFNERKEAHADVPEWQLLYADYIEKNLSEKGGWYYFIHLNDDDIPEILCYLLYPDNGYDFLYIQDGQVKMEWLPDIEEVAVRGGYIYYYAADDKYSYDTVRLLTQENQLITEFDGKYQYDFSREDSQFNYTVNGNAVTESEYIEMLMQAISWEESDEYITLFNYRGSLAGIYSNGTYRSLDEGLSESELNEYLIPLAEDTSSVVSALLFGR